MNKKFSLHLTYICLAIPAIISILFFSGCTAREVVEPIQAFLNKEASIEEESGPIADENAIAYALVYDASGHPIVSKSGENITVMVAYETATGGEIKRDADGDIMTYPDGDVMTFAEGSPVLDSEGNAMTYKGGEPIVDALGIPLADLEGNRATRGEGEVMTYGKDAVMYDEYGRRRVYYEEPLTHKAGDFMYDAYGELKTHAVTPKLNGAGESVTKADGHVQLKDIEIMRDAVGNPIINEDGEIETKIMYPEPPEKIIATHVESGNYYIHSPCKQYVYFNCPEVKASEINKVYPEGYDSSMEPYIDEKAKVNNLQLEMLGPDLPYFTINYDPEGYAYFTMEGTDKILTITGDQRSGANVALEERIDVPYSQYKFWTNPVSTVADNQKWIIKPVEVKVTKETEAGVADDVTTYTAYKFASYADESLVMTIDDSTSNQYANIMVWEDDDRDQQLFQLSKDKPKIPASLKAGTYYIRNGLTNWMMMNVAGWSYDDNAAIQLATASGSDGQTFTISYDEYGFATIAHNGSNMVLTECYGEAINGQRVVQYTEDGAPWQKWILDPIADDGGFMIRSALNYNEVIGIVNENTNVGTEIATYWNEDTYSQIWYFMTEVPEVTASLDTYMDTLAQDYSSDTDFLLMVDNTSNIVGVYAGSKGHWVKQFSWLCCTGKASTPTVKGEFSIYYQGYSFDGNTDSPEWYTCYYTSAFYDAYFFHSIIYYQGTWDVMDGTLGYNVSHGCVRLETENAKWIYDNCPIGTKVVSY